MRRQETELAQILKQYIQTQGPITFKVLMEQALFHPELGFYSRGPAIGSQNGTFNTSAMYPAFAFSLARAVEQADAMIGETLRIVEFGAGTGELGTRILSYLFLCPHEYVVVETSPGLRQKQEALGLRVVDRVEALAPGPSFVFANEVIDAFIRARMGRFDVIISNSRPMIRSTILGIRISPPMSIARHSKQQHV